MIDAISSSIVVVLIGALIWQVRAIRLKLDQLAVKRSAVLETSELESLLSLELQRARRLDYPLSIVSLRLEKEVTGEAAPHDILHLLAADSRHALAADLADGVINIFRKAPDPKIKLRSTDVAVYDRVQHRFVVMLIGTGRADAERIARHLARSIAERLGHSLRYGFAEFPGDQLFAEELIRATEAQRLMIEAPEAESTVAA